jgi:integrase
VGYVVDAIGGERLRDVNADTLDDFERWLHKHHSGSTTMHARAWATLQSALRDAYRRGLIADDPTRRREPLRAPTPRRAMLQPEQFARLFAWVKAHDERMAPVLWFAATTGMRRSELAGLRWVDVDLERARVVVEQAAVQVGREVVVGKPKTRASEGQVVMLDAETIDVLRGIQRQQEADAAEWGKAYEGDGMLVFVDELGRPLRPEVYSRALPRLIERFNRELRVRQLADDSPELATLAKSHGMGTAKLAAIRSDITLVGSPLPVVTWHSLRHLQASLLLASGRNLAAVQRRLGHSSIALTTSVYGHLIEESGREDATAAAALLSPPFRRRSLAIP